jgi:putative endonuclease
VSLHRIRDVGWPWPLAGLVTIRLVHHVYMLRCADGTLYTGYAHDPEQRTHVHNAGRGAKYTASRRPVTLVYSEPHESLSAALKREYELKQWTRAAKEALIEQRTGSAGAVQ